MFIIFISCYNIMSDEDSDSDSDSNPQHANEEDNTKWFNKELSRLFVFGYIDPEDEEGLKKKKFFVNCILSRMKRWKELNGYTYVSNEHKFYISFMQHKIIQKLAEEETRLEILNSQEPVQLLESLIDSLLSVDETNRLALEKTNEYFFKYNLTNISKKFLEYGLVQKFVNETFSSMEEWKKLKEYTYDVNRDEIYQMQNKLLNSLKSIKVKRLISSADANELVKLDVYIANLLTELEGGSRNKNKRRHKTKKRHNTKKQFITKKRLMNKKRIKTNKRSRC